jgi:hypothetical protein
VDQPAEAAADGSGASAVQPEALEATRLRILLLFAGPCETTHALARLLTQRGHFVVAIDTKLRGGSHDVLRREVAEPLLQRLEAGEFDAAFLAPPCSSFSVRHPAQLRSRARPWGVDPLPLGWEAYVAKHNGLAMFARRAVLAAGVSRTPLGLETPADRGDPSSPAYWEAYADRGSLLCALEEELRTVGARVYTFAQCSPLIGGKAQKWTAIATTEALTEELAPLEGCVCEHGAGWHAEVLHGNDLRGKSRAAAAAAYPEGLDRLLADGLERAGLRRREAAERRHEGADGTTPPTSQSSGRITDGPSLCPAISSACEAARTLAPRFASVRNAHPAPAAELRLEPFPGNLLAPVVSLKPSGASKALRRRPLVDRRRASDGGLRRASEAADDGAADEGPHGSEVPCSAPAPPDGPIAIEQLYLEGVYEREVLGWFEIADRAVAELLAGRRPQHVPTRIIGQDQMQPWARGIVWDCRDPAACAPVKRSTRETQFPGRRQLDREAVRHVAERLAWHDEDIISQIGEGGIEPRADCELITVLAFHHESLVHEIDAAAASVQAHIEEEWTAPPVRHLPFVPCRMQPRGVVMQSRARIGADGRLEEYLKPRITTDSSFGGIDSVNAGIPDAERAVVLPSGQTLGRGWAITQSAFDGAPEADGGGTEVGGYCVDAESAYSFCPVQEADLWTQCFLWWDARGRAGAAYDRRMGFGGAFAPNRFERVSTFGCGYAQLLQGEFDLQQPPPLCAQRWTSDRRAWQAQGKLPPGEAQLHPRFVQSFIDDFTGTASTERVVPPPNVASVRIETRHMIAAGCTPWAPDTRVFVHAQLTVLALRTLGMSAPPQKIACGSPLPALGLRFDGARRVIDCPTGKREVVLATCEGALEAAEEELRVDRVGARRLVGRLCNLSQIAPELRQHLHGGYAVTEASWAAGGQRRYAHELTLARGSTAFVGWVALLQEASIIIEANEGAAMAPRLRFPGRNKLGSLTTLTDASRDEKGDDGVGGFAFLAGAPRRVFVFSEQWPADIREALAASADAAQAALRQSGSSSAAPALSMPAAELFGQLLLPRLVARVAEVRRVFAVSDCAPAVRAIDTLLSGKPQMRSLLEAARALGVAWLGVHVVRELNVDADRLSHPAGADAVVTDAVGAGLQPEVLRAEPEDWELLRAAVQAGNAVGGRHRKRKRVTIDDT